MVTASKALAKQYASVETTEAAFRNWITGIAATEFGVFVAWLFIPLQVFGFPEVQSSRFPFSTLGAAVGLASAIIVMIFISRLGDFKNWFRGLALSRSLAPFLLATLSVFAVAPEICTSTGWKVATQSWFFRGLIDGLFIGGSFALLVGVGAFTGLIVSRIRFKNRVWDDPRLQLFDNALRALNYVLDRSAATPLIVKRVLSISKADQAWSRPELAILQFLEASIDDGKGSATSGVDFALNFWRNAYNANKTGKSAKIEVIEDSFFQAFLHSNQIVWPQPPIAVSMATYLRKLAECVELFARRLRTWDIGTDRSVEKAFAERAEYIRQLQSWTLLPRVETRVSLDQTLRQIIGKITQSEWGELPRIDIALLPRPSLWRRVLASLRSLLVAVLPLAAVATFAKLRYDLYTALASTLWTVAIIWFVVSLLVLLDSQFFDKISLFKDLRGMLKGGKDGEK